MPDFLVSRKPLPLQEVQTFLPVPRHTGQFIWVHIPPIPAVGAITGLVGRTAVPGTVTKPGAIGTAAAVFVSGVPVVFVPLPRQCRHFAWPVPSQVMQV